MYRYLLLFAVLCAFCAPLYSANMPDEQQDEQPGDLPGEQSNKQPGEPAAAGAMPEQNVEETESPDDSVEAPKNEMTPEEKQEELEEQQMEEKEKASAPVEKPPGTNMESGSNVAILQGLNKVSATVSRIEAVIGSTVRFGTLEIAVRSCWKSAPGDRPENAALLEINEIKQGEPPARVFLGWMFSSSPGLSSLENPYYDITVIKCDKVDTSKL